MGFRVAKTFACAGDRWLSPSTGRRTTSQELLLMKCMVVCVAVGSLVEGVAAFGGESPVAQELTAAFRRVPLPELPLAAARRIQAAPVKDRGPLTTNVVRAAIGINPAVGAPLVGAIAQLMPDMTELAAAAAVAEVPKEARAITRAAVAAAPSRAGTIVASLCARRPDQFRVIALAAAEQAPTASREILRGIARGRPELRSYLEPFVTGDRRAPSGVQHALDQIERLRQAAAAQHSSTGNFSIAEPVHSAPLGGSAITNDSRMIRGGRNYARP